MNSTNRAVERTTPAFSNSDKKATQCSKIRELRQALVEAGYLKVRQQAESLGLGRSTAWETLQGNHKHSGLSAAIIKRMLASKQLPPPARKILLEYVDEKLAGAYGHNQTQLRRFRERLGANGQSFDAAEEASRVADSDRTDEAENSALRSLTKPSLASSAATSRGER